MLISPFKIACSVNFLVDRVGDPFVRPVLRVLTLFYVPFKSTWNPNRASLSHETLFICLYTCSWSAKVSSFIEKNVICVLQKSTGNPICASLSHETLFICLYTLLGERESVEFYREKLTFCTSKIDSEPHPCVIVA